MNRSKSNEQKQNFWWLLISIHSCENIAKVQPKTFNYWYTLLHPSKISECLYPLIYLVSFMKIKTIFYFSKFRICYPKNTYCSRSVQSYKSKVRRLIFLLTCLNLKTILTKYLPKVLFGLISIWPTAKPFKRSFLVFLTMSDTR